MMDLVLISKVVHSFYDKAKRDILIGYHFRVIENFDEHIPKIVSFWELQINKEITNKDHLPFNILKKHAPLLINKGEIFRWELLFKQTLEEFEELTDKDIEVWMSLVDFFKQRLLTSLS